MLYWKDNHLVGKALVREFPRDQLVPLLFLIYINDLTEDIISLPLIYADDTALFEVVDDPILSADRLNGDLEKISVWSKKWLVTMNPSKCRNIVFSLKHNKPFHPALFLDGKGISKVESHKHLGLTLHSSMSWKSHILRIYEKANRRLNILKSLKFKINRSTLICLYKSLIMSFGIIVVKEKVSYWRAFNTSLPESLLELLKAPAVGDCEMSLPGKN